MAPRPYVVRSQEGTVLTIVRAAVDERSVAAVFNVHHPASAPSAGMMAPAPACPPPMKPPSLWPGRRRSDSSSWTPSAVVVGEDGDVTQFPEPVAHLSPIR